VSALGLDEVLFVHDGPYRRLVFSTSIVDVEKGQLLDVVPGRSAAAPTQWIEARSDAWRAKVRYATLDLSGPYRSVFTKTLPKATQVADPFHLIKHLFRKYFVWWERNGQRIYGYLKNYEPITEEAIGTFVREAESGYTEEQLVTARRGRGRPRLGDDKKFVESVRLGSSLKSEAEQRATAEGISVSEVIRRALAQYLHSA